MSYKVIHRFTDLQDRNYPYGVGDIFPRQGLKVSDERLFELSSDKNKQRKPLIQFVEDKKETVSEEYEYTKTDINRMPINELKELATKKGIENADDLTGAELKKILIDKFGL